jgi:mono/diheme cytochrome c family protein
MHELIALGCLLAVILVLFLARKRVGIFWSAALFYVASIVWLELGFSPPVPSSVVQLYAWTALAAVIMYVTSSEAGRAAFWKPIRATLIERSHLPLRALLFLLIPAVVAWQSFTATLPASVPPPLIRSVHPSPPSTISFTPPGKEEALTVDIGGGENPYRALKQTNPAEDSKVVARGKEVYYQNCYFCHGDNLAADGHYAAAMKPPPATFQSAGIIPALQSTYLFWRIAKGGPGLPDEGTPWDSAMPVWEKYLAEADIWAVLMFLSDFTGFEPRANIPVAHGGAH